jgi:hypothetical protein
MVRYFFHLHERDGLTDDVEGTLFTDSGSAREWAVHCARQLMSHKVAVGVLDFFCGIAVVDGDTKAGFFVTFSRNARAHQLFAGIEGLHD